MQFCFFNSISFLSYAIFQGDFNQANILEYVQNEGNVKHLNSKGFMKMLFIKIHELLQVNDLNQTFISKSNLISPFIHNVMDNSFC